MSIDWSNKEKLALFSDILEFGDQQESWIRISNHLYKIFQIKKEGRYSIKNCKQIYKYFVDLYKNEWIENNLTTNIQIPLAKFIWKKLKIIYEKELTQQLKDNRKKLQEFYLQFQSTIHLKTNTQNQIQHKDFNENQSHQIITENETNENIFIENCSNEFLSTNENEQNTKIESIEIKEEKQEEEQINCSNEILPEKDFSYSNPIETTSTNIISTDQFINSCQTLESNSETKTENIKIIPTTTPKYHVYFSPKNSINPNLNINKTKLKRKGNEEIKEDIDLENSNQNEISPSIEQNKNQFNSIPITRRSINTRSVPNLQIEQEEEKSRRFFAMITENPDCWQSQSMAIIQYLLAHKQGYLFEHEITDEIAPKYHKYIRHPIALDTIRKNLESNNYSSKDYFKKDVYLMLYNAMKYNPRHHHVHKAAKFIFNQTLPLFQLSSQEIQSQINNKTNLSLSTTINETSSVKRKRLK